MAQYDQDYFRKQFEGLPPKAKAIIALRAAMRVLPLLAYRRNSDDQPFSYWKEGDRDRHALDILRSYQASAFVNSLTKAGSADASSSAANAAAAYAAPSPTPPPPPPPPPPAPPQPRPLFWRISAE